MQIPVVDRRRRRRMVIEKYDVIRPDNNEENARRRTQIYVFTHSSRYAFVFKCLYTSSWSTVVGGLSAAG